MGSQSDWRVMKEAAEALKMFDIPFHKQILSAHRTPEEMMDFAKTAHESGFRLIIAGAGGAAHLPGMMASLSPLPVIGVPVRVGSLNGLDSLLSIVQMPKGVPVACVAVENAFNAGLLAAQVLAAQGDENLLNKIKQYKGRLRKKVKAQKLPRS